MTQMTDNFSPPVDMHKLNDAGPAERQIASRHAGVTAWQRSADPSIGKFGKPSKQLLSDKLPEME